MSDVLNRDTVTRHGDLLDEHAAGIYLGGSNEPVPDRTLRQWRYLGQGPAYVKVGHRVRYGTADLDAYLARRRVDPRGAA